MSKINVQYASDEFTEALRRNTSKVVKNLNNSPNSNAWIYSFISTDIFIKKKYTIEDFQLKKPKDDKDYDVIYENAITLYKHLNHLPGFVLSDERFWLWLMFDKFYEVTLALMPIKGNSTFNDHWLFKQGIRRGIFFGVLSRLFFRVKLSIDQHNQEDPYYYTKYAFKNQYRIRELTWRTYSSESHIVLGALKGIEQFFDKNKDIKEKNNSYVELGKYISQLGSVKLLDIMDEQYIQNKVYGFLDNYYQKPDTDPELELDIEV